MSSASVSEDSLSRSAITVEVSVTASYEGDSPERQSANVAAPRSRAAASAASSDADAAVRRACSQTEGNISFSNTVGIGLRMPKTLAIDRLLNARKVALDPHGKSSVIQSSNVPSTLTTVSSGIRL